MNKKNAETPRYDLMLSGDFVIESYNEAKTFANFFPGVAGPHGVPMWVFYVNRGQCICSIGTEDKDHAIMEFLPANRAYQLTSQQGFRTWLKISEGRKSRVYEPFQNQWMCRDVRRTQRMIIRPAELVLEEDTESLGLAFRVEYFNIPEDSYAGFVRILHVTNTGSRPVRIEMLDGLPLVIPFGVDNFNLLHMRRLVESFVECVNYEAGVPFFKGRVKQEDRPDIVPIREGHFYLGFVRNGGCERLVRPIVDPTQVFGSVTDYTDPRLFLEKTPFRISGGAVLENRFPCALGLLAFMLKPGQTHTYYTILGRASSTGALNAMTRRIMSVRYVEQKRRENAAIVEQITQHNFVHSAWRSFDLYCRQNFLDNALRGGLPVSFRDDRRTTVLHLYSRKHGDLERDYNDYRLTPTPYSQGNGNYRDVNQNRRCDLFLNPDVQEDNILHFFNLIQLDGFNPLVIKPARFSVRRKQAAHRILRRALDAQGFKETAAFLANRRFSPGDLLAFIVQGGFRQRMAPDVFMGKLLAQCEKHQESDAGHGFWTDHWTYNLDLIENYLAVYPERLRALLIQRKDFTFYDSPYVVIPRSEKYVIWDGKPMQLDAVRHSAEKEALFKTRREPVHVVRADYGRGDIYRTTLLAKMLSVAVNKASSLDPFGVGIEMEADKPNWYDALNGLPGLFGSSVCETLELKRLLLFLRGALEQVGLTDSQSVPLYEEMADFLHQMIGLLREARRGGAAADVFTFWDRASSARESYRARTLLGVSGREENVGISEIHEFIELVLWKIEQGLRKARDAKSGLLYTYFMHVPVSNRVIRHNGSVKTSPRGLPCFTALRFKQKPLPLFLEGLVHYLRVERNPETARRIYRNVRNSGLFDRKLAMYKVNETLRSQPYEIGRARTFSPGWLENESVWMHMEFKYLLELLRCGLVNEFNHDIKTMLPPFMNPARYGRSILENSSFIASSANPDPSIHGMGFVARLSGSTAEFIHILYLLFAGERPFSLDDRGRLILRFEPKLPADMFSREPEEVSLWRDGRMAKVTLPANTVSFMFLGGVLVTYHNPKRCNTYGPNAVRPLNWRLTYHNGRSLAVEGPELKERLAQDVRARRVRSLDVTLAS